MARSRSAAGGGVAVEVPAARLAGWVARFAGRNDGLAAVDSTPEAVTLRAVDGTTAVLAVPYPPLPTPSDEPVTELIGHLGRVRRVGILAVRAGAFSVGVARDGVVVSSRTDRPYVQGRTAAGGWSQQRFARRRANQLSASLEGAASAAARVLLPIAASLDALVVAGDADALRRVLHDSRLKVLAEVPQREFGNIPEPRHSLLADLVERATVVEITVRDADIA